MNWSALLSIRRTTIIARNNVIAKTANSNNSKTINKGYKIICKVGILLHAYENFYSASTSHVASSIASSATSFFSYALPFRH
jgi:hypothetical protein